MISYVENGENEMMIETSRLILREMNMDDYDALYEVLGLICGRCA